jgi:putative FmdB family regulatory protein
VPTYDYVCQDCGHRFDVRMSISAYSEGVRPTCTGCGSNNAARSFAAVNVLTGSRGIGGSSAAGCGPGGFT